MGCKVFQAEQPLGMTQATRAVVHDGRTPKHAFDPHNTIKNAKQ